MRIRHSCLCILAALCAWGAQPPPDLKPAEEPSTPVTATEAASKRTEMNLLGQTDTKSGESRRNENVQFNQIDNNALRDLQKRLGTTATAVEEFQADHNYYGAEYGNTAPGQIHLTPLKSVTVWHGVLTETHGNSVFSARSFFQFGPVKPARARAIADRPQ